MHCTPGRRLNAAINSMQPSRSKRHGRLCPTALQPGRTTKLIWMWKRLQALPYLSLSLFTVPKAKLQTKLSIFTHKAATQIVNAFLKLRIIASTGQVNQTDCFKRTPMMPLQVQRNTRTYPNLRKRVCKKTNFKLIISNFLINTCWQILVVLDYNFEVYTNSRTWYGSRTAVHLGAQVEPNIKLHSARRRTPGKELGNLRHPNSVNTIYVS